MYQISCAYCPLLYFIALQTWKTSRRREGALFQSVKAKEWFCCVAPHHILEVKQHREHYINDYVVFRRVLTSVPPVIQSVTALLCNFIPAHTWNCFTESSLFHICFSNMHGLNGITVVHCISAGKNPLAYFGHVIHEAAPSSISLYSIFVQILSVE